MEHDAGAQQAHRSGKGQPSAAEHIGQPEPDQNAAEDVQRPGGQPADQQEHEIFRAVLRQIARIFKGGKAYGKGDGGFGQSPDLGLKNQNVEKQRQQLHHFLAHRRDLHHGNGGADAVMPHEEAVDIGGQQADTHAGHHEQHEDPGAPPDKQDAEHQRHGKADENILNIDHFPATSRRASGSSAAKERVSVMSTAK